MKKSIPCSLILMALLYSWVTNSAFAQCGLTSFTLAQPSTSDIDVNNIRLSWGSAGAPQQYMIFYKLTTSTSWQNVSNGTSRSGVLSGLVAGTNYHIKIQAISSCFNSQIGEVVDQIVNSNMITVLTEPEAPDVFWTSEVKGESIRIHWGNKTGASSYYISVYNKNNIFNQGASSTTNSITINNLTKGEEYYIKVNSRNSSGSSPDSNPFTIYTLAAPPVAIGATMINPDAFVANWESSNGASAYMIEVANDQNFLNKIKDYDGLIIPGIASLSVLIESLLPNSIYFYRLKSLNANDELSEQYSNVVQALTGPAAPTNLSVSDRTYHSFVLNWTGNLTGASRYYVDISRNNIFSDLVYENVEKLSEQFSVNGLEPNSAYYCRVRGQNDEGNFSAFSEVLMTFSLPEAPEIISTEQVATDRATIHWTSGSEVPNFLLDVSTEPDFSSTLDQYSNFSLDGVLKTFELTGLASGTLYFVRIRCENVAGASDYSNTLSFQTLPDAPAGVEISQVQSTSSTISWGAVKGAVSYLVDIALDKDFSEIVVADQSVSTNELLLDELLPGTIYYVKVKSVNSDGKLSENSEIGQWITIASAPDAMDAELITPTGFLTKWDNSQGADHYKLFIASISDLSTFLDGYNGLEVSGTELEIHGLNPSQNYYYYVEAVNASGTSAPSNTINVLTLPRSPVIESISDIRSDRFKVLFDLQPNVESYEILVARDNAFNDLVVGNSPKLVGGDFSEAIIEDLMPNTVYYIKMRAKNRSGYSEYSISKTTSTANSSGQITVPEFKNINIGPHSLTFEISNGVGPIQEIRFYHKGISEIEFTEEIVEINSSNQYDVALDPAWRDHFGIEMKLLVKDIADRSNEWEQRVYNIFENAEIPINHFGKSIKDYTIISIPFKLPNARIEDVFEPIMGAYNKSKWRFVQYNGTNNVDYLDGLSVQNLNQGEGYWFVSAVPVNLNIGVAEAPNNSLQKPFVLSLKAGWNQIGNPYLFPVSWTDILNANESTEGIDQFILQFDNESGSFIIADEMEVMRGGFVYSEKDTQLKIPVTINDGKAGTGGRQSHTRLQPVSGWLLPISVKAGAVENKLAGIGMSSDASLTKDLYDIKVPPRFGDFIEVNSKHDGGDFTFDVVPESEQWKWELILLHNANESEEVQVTWDSRIIQERQLSLYLLDQGNGVLVDMSKVNSYAYKGNKQQISIQYGAFPNELNVLKLGQAYPNPMGKFVNIPFAINFSEELKIAQLEIFNNQGQLIFSKTVEFKDSGIGSITWDGNCFQGGEASPGFYHFKLIVKSTSNVKSIYQGKIIKQ